MKARIFILLFCCTLFFSGCEDTRLKHSRDSERVRRDIEQWQREVEEQQAKSGDILAHIILEPRKTQQYINDHPELSERIKQYILKEKIVLGMTKEDVEASWGKPNDIHRSVYSFGVHEQWIYGSRNFLYFEDCILTSWQD